MLDCSYSSFLEVWAKGDANRNITRSKLQAVEVCEHVQGTLT